MASEAGTVRIELPKTLGLTAAAPLTSRLLGLQGSPVVLDAAHVERLGGLCLQVLLSALATWKAAGVALTIENPSPAFEEAWRLFAAPPLPPSLAA